MNQDELKDYNVVIGISGVASVKIKARNPEEAKELLLKNAERIGENDYFWWFNEENPTVAVSENESYCPQVNDIEELREDNSWLFV